MINNHRDTESIKQMKDCFTSFAMTPEMNVIAREERPKQSKKLYQINNLKSYTFLLLLLLCISNFSFSQDVVVEAKLDTNVIQIGEQTLVHLSVKYKTNQGKIEITWPVVGDTIIKQIEVLAKSKIDTVKDTTNVDNLIQTQAFTITSFDSGYFVIPPFRFIVNGDTANVKETDPLLIETQVTPVDTSKAIKDIKPPFEEPFDLRELIPYVLWGGGILALVVLVIILIRKLTKKKPEPVFVPEVKIPAHIKALEALEKLKNEKLWQEGKIKLYYSTLSDILRMYIEERFKIYALEQTTDEIVYAFRNVEIGMEEKAKLKQLLVLADLVKFAKEQPLPNENESCWNNAVDFVNKTKLEEQIERDVKSSE